MHRTVRVLVFVMVCIGLAHSWDFAVSVDDRLQFYMNDFQTDSVRLHSQNPSALAYDEVHNMLLYVDKQSGDDAICGYNISSVEYKCFVKRSGRDIQGLAYDPITQYLFFTDTKEKSINWISFQPGSNNHVNGNLLMKMDEGTPTDIVVDSCRGHIYWINTNLTTSRIERARFDGSEREIVINTTYKIDLHSLAIDQQAKKMYWMVPQDNSRTDLGTADLDGKDYLSPIIFTNEFDYSTTRPNALTFSRNNLYVLASWPNYRSKTIYKFLTPPIKLTNSHTYQNFISTESKVGIVANYNIYKEFEGIQECQYLVRLMPHNPMKIAREYEVSSCAHGVKVDGQSVCKCTPGYTGDQCEVSVCHNYCLNGNCSFNDEGLPECRCTPGYTGDRCEVDSCLGYCSNNGTCALNADHEPVCQCIDDYGGDRCEVADCLNYCLQGKCSLNSEGLPECRCKAGYRGDRCEVDSCLGYCLNNGSCFFNEESELFCQCSDGHEGTRCEIVTSEVTVSREVSTYNSQGNFTLSDLLNNSRKPDKTVYVVVKVNL